MGTATTNSTGYWQVCKLVPGSYRVTETIKPGWMNSNPNQNVVLGCENKTNVNFRNTPLLCISGYKFNGCNGQPLAGWQIEVFNSSTGASMGTATTNATGYWQVCKLVPGNYRVTRPSSPAGEQQPQPDCGSWMRKQDRRELPEHAAACASAATSSMAAMASHWPAGRSRSSMPAPRALNGHCHDQCHRLLAGLRPGARQLLGQLRLSRAAGRTATPTRLWFWDAKTRPT